jgi:peptidoglycan/LPS O-acetylase OafA/YrhL
LDSIRALAVLAVYGAHVGWGPLKGGWIGVGVFFTLSGYLITTILLREWHTTGGVRLRRFYLRRLLRLYPALLLLLAICGCFAPLFGDGGTAKGYNFTAAATGFYVQDFVLGLTGDAHGFFRHTWSLAVEEQFYLIWPPVLIALLKRGRNPLTWAIFGTAISWTLLALTTRTDGVRAPATYALPHTRAGELLLGCALAIWLNSGRPHLTTARWFGSALVPASLLTLAALGLTSGEAGLSRWMPQQIMLSAGATAVLIFALVTRDTPAGDGNPLLRLLGWRPLVWLGTVSYGFYLFHLPALQLLEHYGRGSWALRTMLALALAIIAAAASHRLVERPFLRLKDRLQTTGNPHVTG